MSPRAACVVASSAVVSIFAACSGTSTSPRSVAPAIASPAPVVSAPVVSAPVDPAPVDLAPDLPATVITARSVDADGFSGVAPQWIWSSRTPGEREVVVLQRTFDIPRPVARATLRASADNHVRVFLNGELVGAHDEWRIALVEDVGAYLHRGENVLAIVAQNEGGPAGAWTELVVEDPAGKRVRVATDGSWLAASLPDDARFDATKPTAIANARTGPAHSFGAFGVGPWLGASSSAEGADSGGVATPIEEEVGHALAPEAIQVPPGFRVEMVHEVPRATEGSWVSMAEDPRGRIYVSDQHGRLFRVTPSVIGAAASTTRVEPVAVDIGSAHGLCWAFDSLYVVVSERDPGRVTGLYRLRDTDGDDQLDRSELLRELHGNGEHGPHAVRPGPDGALWIVAGNHTDLPEPLARSRVPRTWAEDNALPRIDDPGGHAVGRMAPGGWIARTDENGKDFELVTAGFRNAYDFAFDPRGEVFTFDSDMEWDVGAPWYRPTRILHAVSGADFGWRNGSTKWPADSIDTWPSVCDMGRASPTGVEFGTRAKFPQRWRDALYACDWSFGTIYAVQTEADGASWRGKSEVFARGEPFQVTDAMIGQDGAMYVTTGGRNTRSAMYRIAWTGAVDEPARRPERLIVVQKRRRELEQLHVATERAWPELENISLGLMSSDRFLSGAARVALEFTPIEQWDSIAAHCSSRESQLQYAVAALHVGGSMGNSVLDSIEHIAGNAQRTDPRLDALRVVQLALTRADPLADWRQTVAERVSLDLGAGREGREAAIVLAVLGSPPDSRGWLLPERLLERIDASTTQEDAIHFAYCLRAVKNGWTPALRERFLDFLDGRAKTFQGGDSLTKYVTRIRDDFVARLPEVDRAALAGRLAPPKPPQAVSTAPAAFVRRWTRPELEALLASPLHASPLHDRSFDAGKQAFSTATCITCHRIGDAGGATGPDLTSTAARFGIADMLDAIVEPSKTISDQYRDMELRTTEGDLYVGRIEAEQGGTIRLRRTPGDELVEIEDADVEMRRPYPLSRMPNGLLDTLDEAGVLDLFAYLRSGGNAAHPAFRH